jgi:hypothetical protein
LFLLCKFSSKYYAELNNRVNTINDFSFNQGLKSIKNRSSKIFFESKPIVTNMKDYTLLSYYRSLDTNTCNLQHLAYVENELVKRKMGIFCGKNRLNNLNVVFENVGIDSDGVIYYDFK